MIRCPIKFDGNGMEGRYGGTYILGRYPNVFLHKLCSSSKRVGDRGCCARQIVYLEFVSILGELPHVIAHKCGD